MSGAPGPFGDYDRMASIRASNERLEKAIKAVEEERAYTAFLQERVREMAAKLTEQVDALNEVAELIAGYVDIVDGDETSGPLPNNAMRATRVIEATLAKLNRIGAK